MVDQFPSQTSQVVSCAAEAPSGTPTFVWYHMDGKIERLSREQIVYTDATETGWKPKPWTERTPSGTANCHTVDKIKSLPTVSTVIPAVYLEQ